MENLNLATNAELKKRQEELQTEFEQPSCVITETYYAHRGV